MAYVDPRDPSGLVTRPSSGTVLSSLSSVRPWGSSRFDVVTIGQPNALLARHELRVGVAATIVDDAVGRALVDELGASGADVSAVSFVPRRTNLILTDVAAAADRDDETPVELPSGWSSDLLLLSGLSPALARAAASCKAARAARRQGSLVMVDVNASRDSWKGRDARTIYSVLREADVVRCSTSDLATLWLDTAAVQGAMRPHATLIVTAGPGPARARGPFGEVVVAPTDACRTTRAGVGDAFTAALVAALARGADPARSETWERSMRTGHAAARAFIGR